MQVALMRLDGLGGTVTLSDQAKKIYQLTGEPVILITRGYEGLFKDNPYVAEIINVGGEDWQKCLSRFVNSFDILGELRFIVGKWHFNRATLPVAETHWRRWEQLYFRFPLLRSPQVSSYHDLDTYDLNQTQILDMSLGLPFSTIECEIYAEEPVKSLPPQYILVNNGIDTQYKGSRQTKMYPYWDQLYRLLPLPMVQVGTAFDSLIQGVECDLRGKTSLPELTYVLRNATLVLCTEGGIMHLSYAASCKSVVVMRGPSAGPINKYPGHVVVDSYICSNCWWVTSDWFCRCALGIDNVCMRSISPERVAFVVERRLHEDLA